MKYSICTVALLCAVPSASAQQPTTPLEITATELQDRIAHLNALVQQSAEDSRRVAAVRQALGEASPRTALRATAPEPEPSAFTPVLSALIQALTLAIATLTPLAIAWAAWELRRRTGVTVAQQDAKVLATAVHNSLGAMQRATTLAGGQPAEADVGTAYVLRHAGPEAKRLGVSPDAIRDKVQAQLGLQKTPA